MSHLIGSDWVDRFTVLDDEGGFVTGVVFTADQNFDPSNGLIAYTITDLGAGFYELRAPVTANGLYYLRLVTDQDPFQVFEFSLSTDDYEVDGNVVQYFTLLDGAGNFYGGSVISILNAIDPTGNVFVPTISDMSNGLYRVQWTAQIPGVHTLRISADRSDTGDEPQIFEFEAGVFAVTVAPTPFIASPGSTLDELVRGVAVACRDYQLVIATRDAVTGDDFTDEYRLAARSPKFCKGADLFITRAALDENVGMSARVRDFTDPSLTLSPALPAPVRRGDRGYLVNLEGGGFNRDTYVEEINAVIDGCFPNMLQPAVWTFEDGFDAALGYLVPPSEFTHLYDVSYPTPGWAPYETHIPYADVNQAGWSWDYAAGRLIIGGGYRQQGSAALFTIRGYGPWQRLENASDTTGIDYQWLKEMAAGELILSLRDNKRQSEAAMHMNRADGYLAKAAIDLPPNTIRIR